MLDFIEENNQIPGMNGGKDRSNQCSDMISAALIGKDVPVKCHSDLAPLFKFWEICHESISFNFYLFVYFNEEKID